MSNQTIETKDSNTPSTVVRITEFLDTVVTRMNLFTHYVSSILLFLLMILTVADVTGRYFFNSPIKGTLDLTKVAMAVIVFFSLGYAQIKGNHLEIDFITAKFPKRVQHLFAAVTYFVMLIVLSLLTWQMFLYGLNTSPSEYSGDLHVPLYLFILLVAVGSFVFTCTYIVLTLKYLLKAVSKN